MSKTIRFNAFEMNCVGHQSPGLWTHPRDRISSSLRCFPIGLIGIPFVGRRQVRGIH